MTDLFGGKMTHSEVVQAKEEYRRVVRVWLKRMVRENLPEELIGRECDYILERVFELGRIEGRSEPPF